MKQFVITAYADADRGLPKQKTMIEAVDLADAQERACRLFDEYKEVGVAEVTKVVHDD